MTGPALAQLIGRLLALVLVVRGLGRRQLGRERLMLYGGLWLAIIVMVTLLVDWLQ